MAVTSNNEQKVPGPIQVGLIASGPRLPPLAAAIEACVLLQPVGQAGMPASAAVPGLPRFDDPRLLLAHPELQAVVLAVSTRADLELAGMAAQRGLHVWRLPPLARSFAEACEVVARSRQLPTIYRVASWWEYVADHVWHELHWPPDFVPVFSDLRAGAPGPGPDAWQSRLTDAAGGVLPDAAYHLLEALVAVRGIPDSAVGLVGRLGKSPVGVNRETEDVAVAILRFPAEGIAVLQAAWDRPPFERRLVHHGPAAIATLTDDEVRLTDASGADLDHRPLPGDFLTSELLRFAESICGQARDRAAAPMDRHLAVSALLEAIYLSARTNHPESPRKFYQLQGCREPTS